MEEKYFNKIRDLYSSKNTHISYGKMMSSEAITYNGKVFAFFSRKKKMVFKLGKEFDYDSYNIELSVFNPLKKRAPLHGWFEVSFTEKEHWKPLTEQALIIVKQENNY